MVSSPILTVPTVDPGSVGVPDSSTFVFSISNGPTDYTYIITVAIIMSFRVPSRRLALHGKHAMAPTRRRP